MYIPLQIRLTSFYIVLLTLALVFFGALVYTQAEQRTYASLDATLKSRAASVQLGKLMGDQSTLPSLLPGIAGADTEGVAIEVFDEQVGRPQDLKAVEYTMLALIQANPGVSPARLRKALCLSAPYVTSSLEKLHTRGFILREVNQQDRRGQHLRVTRAAERLVAELVG